MSTPPMRLGRERWPSLFPVALLGAIALLVSAGCQRSPEAERQKAYEQGQEYLRQGKDNEAIIAFQNAVKADANFAPALHLLGRAYARKHWVLDAARELTRARRLAPESVPIAVDLGRALVELGDWDGARAEADEVLGKDPAHRDGLYLRAATLVGTKKFEEALRILDALPGPRATEAELARAEALLNLGRIERAQEALRSAKARDPADARILAALAALAYARQQYAEAVQLYGEAKQRRPDDPRIRLGLAASEGRLGHVDEAILELEEVPARARTAVFVNSLAVHYLDARRPHEAVSVLAPVVTQLPRHVQARFLLGIAHLAANAPDHARIQFEELERQLPGEAVVKLRLSQAESALGRARESLARLDTVAQALAESSEYHIQRARDLMLLRRSAEALRAAETARRLAPISPEAYLVLGGIRLQQGQVAAAREMLARSAALDSDYEPTRLAIGRLLFASGETAAAFQEFDAAVRAAPRSLVALREKAQALARQGRTRDAIQAVEAAIKAEPRVPGFRSLLGALLVEGKQWDAAGEVFRKELELAPRRVEAHMGLASLALRKAREDEAIGQLREALQVRPDHPTAILLLAALYTKQGRSDLLLPVLEAADKESRRRPSVALILADVYLKTGRNEDAVKVMTDVLAQSPGLPQARLIRGQARLARGEAAHALQEISEVAAANPDSSQAQYALAQANVALGRTAEAQAAYRAVLKLAPEFHTARAELAALTGQAMETDTERRHIEALQAAIKADPNNVLFREMLVRALLLQGQTRRAQAELQHILGAVPLHLGANFLTARMFLTQGKDEEAVGHLQTVLRSNPSHLESHLLLAAHFQARGQRTEAIGHLEAALGVNPGLGDAKYRLGHLYADTGRSADAMAIARELEGIMAGKPEPALLKGRVLLDQRDAKAALAAFQAAVRLKPDHADTHRWVGQAHGVLDQPELAILSYQRALALDGTNVVALNNLAWALSETRRRPDLALPLVSKAAELAPKSPEVLDTLGWVHFRRGVYAEAEKALVRAVERNPQSAIAHYHLGMTYYRLGRKSDALFSLRRASQLDQRLAETEKIGPLIKELGG